MTQQDGPDPHPVSASGRVPQWVLDEAAGRVPVSADGRSWTPSPAPRRTRRTLLMVLAGIAILAAVGWSVRATPSTTSPAPADQPAVAAQSPDAPTPGRDAGEAPIGQPPAPPEEPGDHAFVTRQEDGVAPVAYDPCRPIDVVIRLEGAPPGAEALVLDGLARMSEVTGLQFRYEGVTDEVPGDTRPAFQPDRYGDRWAPVLISWRTPEEQPSLAGPTAGQGGSAWAAPPDGLRVYVSGSVTLDGPEFADLIATDTGAEIARAILLHELGHLVGLQHVWDSNQLMYSTTNGTVLDFADGDLTGLAQLGAGECVPEL